MSIENLDLVQTISAKEIVLDEDEDQKGISVLDAMNRVRELMSARSMAEVAKKLGITSQNLNNILKRRRLPFEKIARWCNIYGVSINWILFGTGSAKMSDKVVEKDPNSDYLIKLLREKVDILESQLASRQEEVPHTQN
tara:strand:- start:1345 stop:1761 length:417 start_codon:yes stop_codon:yes gene_type:complete